MTRRISLIACVALSLVGCKLIVTRADQDNFVLSTDSVSAERFLDALSESLSGNWQSSDYAPPDSDQSKMYTLEASGVTVVLVPMPHDRCNPNASHHITFDHSYRVDLVYRTSASAKREAAKRKLFEAASAI